MWVETTAQCSRGLRVDGSPELRASQSGSKRRWRRASNGGLPSTLPPSRVTCSKHPRSVSPQSLQPTPPADTVSCQPEKTPSFAIATTVYWTQKQTPILQNSARNINTMTWEMKTTRWLPSCICARENILSFGSRPSRQSSQLSH